MCTKVVDKSYLEIADYLAEHPDCGCILFDISHYIEDVNLPPIFDFSFSVNGENCGDFVVNHRFPNHFYWTLSKKNGRRLSKAGYPFYIKLEKFTGELSVQVNAKMESVELTKRSAAIHCGALLNALCLAELYDTSSRQYKRKCPALPTSIPHI